MKEELRSLKELQKVFEGYGISEHVLDDIDTAAAFVSAFHKIEHSEKSKDISERYEDLVFKLVDLAEDMRCLIEELEDEIGEL